MKTIISRLSLCFFLLFSVCLTSYADDPSGIKFFTGSWKDVLAEAKRQNKPVFVDIFTTWCGPCKMMAKQAFPDAKVGGKFNTNFVSYQIDAEKGEGIEVARKYAVTAYPTSLYLSADGNLIHRAIGYGGIKEMLEEADKAVEAANDPNPLSAMEKQYEGGKRDSEFLAAYLQKRARISMPNGNALEAYLKTVPEAEWESEENIALIAGNVETYNVKIKDLLFKKLVQLKDATGDQAVMLRNKLGESVFKLNQALFEQAVATKDEQMLADVIKTNDAYLTAARGVSSPIEIADGYRMRFYQQTKNMDKYRALVTDQANKLMNIPADSLNANDERAYKQFQMQTAMMPDSVKNRDDFKKYAESMKNGATNETAMKLNNLAWAYYETTSDKKDLNQALTWSAKSLEYDRSGMHLDTYAHLLSKLGRRAEAIKTQQEAIAKEKAAGGDVASYEKELAIMKQK